MNELWVFSYIILPLLIGIGGYVAVRLHERDLDRRHKHHNP